MTASESTITSREPESAIILASSPAVAVGFTGTATAWARRMPRYDATNSSRLPITIITRWPATTPAAPSPVASRPTSSSSSAQVMLRPPASTSASLSGFSAAARISRSATSVARGGAVGSSSAMDGYFHTGASGQRRRRPARTLTA